MNTPDSPTSPTGIPRAVRPLPGLAAPLLLVAALLAMAGCEAPASRQPIGSTPLPLQETRFAGVWNDADGKPWHVRVVDPGAGRLEVVTVNQEKDEPFRLQRLELLLRTQDEATLFNLRETEPGGAADVPYLFGRTVATDHAILLFPANPAALRRRVLDGTVGAEITTHVNEGRETYEILVTNRYDRLAAELARPEGWQLLETRQPWVFTRSPAQPR